MQNEQREGEAGRRGPFSGLRVVEFGQNIAGPYCAQLLADGGAEVIKVESPSGDPTRRTGAFIPGEGRQFLNKNRGKRSLVVNFQHPRAPEIFGRLVRGADVVISNLRPGLLDSLGISYERVSAERPAVIYAEVTGFGRAGPLAGEGGYDIILQSATGITASFGKVKDGTPQGLEYPTADYGTALLMAFGIAGALYARAQTGRGQRVDTSLLASSLALQNNTLLHVDALDSWRDDWLADLTRARAAGESIEQLRERRGRHQPEVPVRAYYRTYATSDGFVTIGGLTPALQAKIREVIGFRDPWMEDPDATPPDPLAYAEAVGRAAEEAISARPTVEWVQLFRAAGVPVSPLQFPDELFHDEQVAANQLIVTLEHPLVGTYRQVAPPLQLSETPFGSVTPSPTLGMHTEAVLRETGYSDDEIATLVAAGAVQ